jgi:hypothetical protein
MAEHTRFHLWFNTVVASVALAASATSGYFAWKTYNLKTEALGFTINPTYECRLEFQKVGDEGLLSLCWVVIITNQSDIPISIVRFQAFDVSDNNRVFRSGFSALENARGEAISPPLSLGAGEPLQYLMRVPISVPAAVAALVETLPQNSTLHQLQSLTLKTGLDVVGNKVEVKYFDELKQQASVAWIYGMRVALGEIRFLTGRGNMFVARMSFPPILHTD